MMTPFEHIRSMKRSVGALSLELVQEPDCLRIRPQSQGHSILQTLTEAGQLVASEFALDCIFLSESVQDIFLHTFDVMDALKAYSTLPIKEPPAAYLNWARELRSASNWLRQERAIILAGRDDSQDRELLLWILARATEDMRDAPIYAASSYDDIDMIEAVCKIILSVEETTSCSTGELHAATTCFRRWLRRKSITSDKLYELLGSMESKDTKLMRRNRLWNYVHCQEWSELPFPKEPPLGLLSDR